MTFDWQTFLERWNTEAMRVHLRALRRGGIAEYSADGRRVALLNIVRRLGLEIPEPLLLPFGDAGSDTEVLAEAQRRIAEVDALIIPALRERRPHADLFGDDYHWAVIRNGGHFFAPADEATIDTAERRLGTALTTSYKDFLRVSNGWLTISSRITPVEHAAWLRDKGPDWIDNYGRGDEKNPERALRWHAIYGKEQDPPRYYGSYLKECLQLSDPLAEINCVFLLNPAVVFETGEWESWFLASWLPGAHRFKSFCELMDWMRTTDLRELAKADTEQIAPR
jgi:hypothetical protein